MCTQSEAAIRKPTGNLDDDLGREVECGWATFPVQTHSDWYSNRHLTPGGRDSQCDHDQVESGSVDDSVVRRAHSVTKGARPVDLASGLLV